MYIHLKWSNLNTQDVTINVYRSATTIDRANPGTPLVTLPATAVDYYDRTVVVGSSYYYVIEFVSTKGKVSSRNYQFTAQYYRGHGSNLVVVGDDNYGFMGQLTFPSMNVFTKLLGINRATAGATDDAILQAFKFSIDGKVYITVDVNMSYMAVTDYAAFAKRPTPLPVTIDGFNYLAFAPNFVGLPTPALANGVPTGDNTLAHKLVSCLMYNLPFRGRPHDRLGRIGTYSQTTSWVTGDLGNDTTRLPVYRADSDAITWSLFAGVSTASYEGLVILELVE